MRFFILFYKLIIIMGKENLNLERLCRGYG